VIPHLRLPLDISCINTGAAAGGLTQGDGWGHSSRMFGLACDSLAEEELVDAGGRFIIASETSHPNLFWALWGDGGGKCRCPGHMKEKGLEKLFFQSFLPLYTMQGKNGWGALRLCHFVIRLLSYMRVQSA